MLRGAVVGFGFIAQGGHLPAFTRATGRKPMEIVAIADECPARLAIARETLPHARLYESHEQLLRAEGDRIDFVDIATPPYAHAEIAHAALNRGLHVFCEKPLATSARDAAQMLEHAAEARRVVFPSHNYKHAPVVKAVRRAIDSDKIGRVVLITLNTFRNTHAKGVAEWRPNWRRERHYSGGGIGMDHGSHTFYLAFDWFGGYPIAITAKANTLGPYDTEDDLTCTMTFAGGIASAHLTWNAGIRKALYTVHGHRGAVRVEDDSVEIARMSTDENGRAAWCSEQDRVASHWADASHVHWFTTVFDAFARAIKSEDYVGSEALDSLKCVQLIELAYESARQGSRELPLRTGILRRPRLNGDHSVALR